MSESTDLHELAQRLERLETTEAARSTLFAYAQAVDTRNWSMLGGVFSEDAVCEMPGLLLTGRTAIVEAMQGMLPTEFITRHLIVNPQVTWTAPGRATVRATVYYAHEGSGFEATGWGDYTDEIVVTDGIGVITRTVFTPAVHLPGSVSSFAPRLQQLETAELARAVSWRYANAVDTPDFDLLESVFTEDAVLTTSKGSCTGREEVLGYYATALAGPVKRKHFLVNQSLTPLGPDLVLLESYFLYTFSGQDTSTIGWGNYVDRIQIIDGVAYIQDKRISADLHADSRIGWARP
jgi:3-phenylpropionate/cinnamic acid dioxygenase small subunit